MDAAFVSSEGSRGVFTRRWLFSLKAAPIYWLSRALAGQLGMLRERRWANMKITQGPECADIENNDWEEEEGGGGRDIRKT